MEINQRLIHEINRHVRKARELTIELSPVVLT